MSTSLPRLALFPRLGAIMGGLRLGMGGPAPGQPREPDPREPIWWMFDYQSPPPRILTLMGVGMTKIQFAQKVGKLRGWVPSDVYRHAYGRASMWRVDDPAAIAAAYQHYGKIFLYNVKTDTVVEVFDGV